MDMDLLVKELGDLIVKSRNAVLGGLSQKEKERGLEVFEMISLELPDDRNQACIHSDCIPKRYSNRALQGFTMCRVHVRSIFDKSRI